MVPQYINFLHIAKCAGTSLMKDLVARDFQFEFHAISNNELCHAKIFDRRAFNIVYLRSPRAHVLSQFLHCKHSRWGKMQTEDRAGLSGFPRNGTDEADFAQWVDYFYSDSWRPTNSSLMNPNKFNDCAPAPAPPPRRHPRPRHCARPPHPRE